MDKRTYRHAVIPCCLLLVLYLSGCRSDKSQFLKDVEENDWEAAQTILDRNPGLVNAYLKHGYTLLHVAVYNNNKRMAIFLIQNGIDVNTVTREEDQTPLYLAASMGHYEMASFLIENGADVNYRDDISYTPLHAACMASQKEIVNLLLAQGAEVDAKTQDEKTPLFYVSCSNDPKTEAGLEIIRMLLDKGADLNFKCGSEHPIIVSALANRQFKKAELLADYGAVLELPTEEGIRPLKGYELKKYIQEISHIPGN